MIQEFMDFLLKNNVIGVAVGLLIATKVGEVIKSLIEDLITPLILQPVFKKLKVENIEQLSARGVLYGKVIARVIEFIVVAFIVFMVIKNLGVKTA
jgi:large conductance mechanosensitive channel